MIIIWIIQFYLSINFIFMNELLFDNRLTNIIIGYI
jgi:hypothetical protein